MSNLGYKSAFEMVILVNFHNVMKYVKIHHSARNLKIIFITLKTPFPFKNSFRNDTQINIIIK